MPDTPNRLRATTRKPDTAPPRRETVIASLRLRVAAEAARLLERTEMYMPMYPARPDAAAPTRNAMPVRRPSSQRPTTLSPYSPWAISLTPSDTAPTMTAMITPVARARTAMVPYWRFRKAMAPSKIIEATSCISGVPLSRRSTSQASHRA